MGYDVHITRRDEWYDEDGPIISRSEWLAYVSSDPEMRADGYAEAKTPDGSVLRVDDEGIAVWTAYPGHEEDGNMAWFRHFEGHVTVKNPDKAILIKMHRIASALNAKVQGDDGEEYGADANPTNREEPLLSTSVVKKPWWKFW